MFADLNYRAANFWRSSSSQYLWLFPLPAILALYDPTSRYGLSFFKTDAALRVIENVITWLRGVIFSATDGLRNCRINLWRPCVAMSG